MEIIFDTDIGEHEFIFRSPKDKKEFLAKITDTTYTSIIGNDKRLLNEIETWMNNY